MRWERVSHTGSGGNVESVGMTWRELGHWGTGSNGRWKPRDFKNGAAEASEVGKQRKLGIPRARERGEECPEPQQWGLELQKRPAFP